MDIAEIKQRLENREHGKTLCNNPLSQYDIKWNAPTQDDDIRFLLQELEKLQRTIDDHGPEGRNYTNAQYVALRQDNERYKEALDEIYKTDDLVTILKICEKLKPD